MIYHRRDESVHICAIIPGQPYLSFFYSYCLLPVPLQELLSTYENKIRERFGFYCESCLQIRPQEDILSGYEKWVLYCHCENPKSLQCLASAMWITPKIVKFMETFTWAPSLYNHILLSNGHGSRMCHVVCSTFFHDYHLIVLNLVTACRFAIEALHIRAIKFYKEYDTTFAFIKCRRCSDRNEMSLRACAQRVSVIVSLAHAGVRITAYDKRRFQRKYKARLEAIMNMVFDHRTVYSGLFQ